MITLAVDPGKCTGWALFDGARLRSCGTSAPPRFAEVRNVVCDWLVIERPHEGAGKASKSDLVTLAARMGAVKALVNAANVEEVLPVRWKGSTPKKIMTLRIGERWMTADDREAASAACRAFGVTASKMHNVLDAIGTGIWFLRPKGLRD